MRKALHIVLLVLILAGCVKEPEFSFDGPGFQFTVRCADLSQTKAEKDGVQAFNENLIKSVDFLFYPGENPADDTDAVFHVRKELDKDPMQPGIWEATFNIVVKKDVIGQIFPDGDNSKATVYVLVNFDRSFIGDLSLTSRAELAARRIVNDFAEEEQDYIQPKFLMDGKAVVTYNEDANPNVSADIPVSRFASKLTIAVNVAQRVVLKHIEAAQPSDQEPDEVWTPVPHTARIYLVWGVKSVLLSNDFLVPDATISLPDATPDDPNKEYFSYSSSATRRPFVKDNGTPYLETETIGDKVYYNTYPMYSYPTSWNNSVMTDPATVDYTQGLPPEAPYFKLEMDWRREPENGYSYDRRKYYYKVYMPFNEFKRNSWYGFYLDVSILGSETDEGNALLEPTCYLLDWQNKALAINKYAVISKARYLEVEKKNWDINNMDQLVIPFISSHNVAIVPGTIKATRPYFGTDTTSLPKYDDSMHAWIKKDKNGTFYLDYNDQPSGKEKWEPSRWLIPQSTSIRLDHPMQNNNTIADFDYSVYTIEFDIVHTDLLDAPQSHTYSQYVRHIKIVQRPGIYIDRLRNSDTTIVKRDPSNTNPQGLYGYPDGEEPWTNKPWGYVYVNGGRFIRSEKLSHNGNQDRYFSLHESNRKEYQWQTVWYTGGSKDIYNIHVTVLPSTSSFVIGDPRESRVNNLDNASGYPGLYEFTVGGNNKFEDVKVLETLRYGTEEYPEVSSQTWRRTGFNEADALYGEAKRSLQWYYPTENSSRTENMVAPGYRISSKFSGIEFGNLDKKYAEYRCAAFQEDGFPAGRWRLPTKAEINFIGMLSAKGFFEFLFNNNGTYWSANGAVKVTGTSVSYVNSSTALLRCVYDSWYWDKVDGLEDDPRHNPRDKFVWGDRER